jgi:hypothetical protein
MSVKITFPRFGNQVHATVRKAIDDAFKHIQDLFAARENLQKQVTDNNAVLSAQIQQVSSSGSAGSVVTVPREAFAVDEVFWAAVPTDPHTILGYGTWTYLGQGKIELL